MELTIAQKCLLHEIATILSYISDYDSLESCSSTDDIDCTELACSFIFGCGGGGDFTKRDYPFSTINRTFPKDSEKMKKMRRDYPQKVINNKNTGKRYINKAITYLTKPFDIQCEQTHQKINTFDDDGENNGHMTIYTTSNGIVNISVIEKLCNEIGWLCLLMGYTRNMIQRINFSVLNDGYKSDNSLLQIVVISQVILLM